MILIALSIPLSKGFDNGIYPNFLVIQTPSAICA